MNWSLNYIGKVSLEIGRWRYFTYIITDDNVLSSELFIFLSRVKKFKEKQGGYPFQKHTPTYF